MLGAVSDHENQLSEQIRASMEKATPREDIEQISIWKGKTDDFCRMLGLR